MKLYLNSLEESILEGKLCFIVFKKYFFNDKNVKGSLHFKLFQTISCQLIEIN